MSGYSVIPARFLDELKRLIGCRLVAAKRYSWWSPEDVGEHGVSADMIFSLTAGPASVEFDSGVILGFASDPSLCSVMVWMERDEKGRCLRDETLDGDTELHEISSTDRRFSNDFWQRIIGATILDISIVRRNYKGIRISERPCQVGVAFKLDNGEVFLMAHGLHDDSDDFALIESSQVLPSIREDLIEVSIQVLL